MDNTPCVQANAHSSQKVHPDTEKSRIGFSSMILIIFSLHAFKQSLLSH